MSKENKGKISAFVNFFPSAWQELKKVHTPTRQETIQGTLGVILLVCFFGIFLGLTDMAVGRLMQAILT